MMPNPETTLIAVGTFGTFSVAALVMVMVAIARSFADWNGNSVRFIVVGAAGVATLIATYAYVQVSEANVDTSTANGIGDYVVYFLILWLATVAWAFGQYNLIESAVIRSMNAKALRATREAINVDVAVNGARFAGVTMPMPSAPTPATIAATEHFPYPLDPDDDDDDPIYVVGRDVAGNPLMAPQSELDLDASPTQPAPTSIAGASARPSTPTTSTPTTSAAPTRKRRPIG